MKKALVFFLVCMINASAFAESIEPSAIDFIIEAGKPSSTYMTFSKSQLFYRGSRIYGCEGVADNCEKMSHLVCKKLGYNKAIEFSWSSPESITSDNFITRLKEGQIWALQKNEKGILDFALYSASSFSKFTYVFSSLTCSM